MTKPTWAADLAQLEWLSVQAWLAPQAPALDLQALSVIAPEDHHRLVLNFAPSLQIARLSHHAWQFLHDLPLERRNRQRDVAVWAFDGTHKMRLLTSEESLLIRLLQAGLPLGRAVSDAGVSSSRAPRHIARDIGTWFQDWAQDGLVTGVTLAPP